MKYSNKNTVPSKHQLDKNDYVSFINSDVKGIKVLFIGNSITRHGVAPEIGWNRDCGMAASAVDNDYVHLLIKKISGITPAAFCVCQNAEWERNYKNGENFLYLYEQARNFNADIIVCRFIENCPDDQFDEDLFKRQYKALVNYFNLSGKAKIILTTGFWKKPGDKTIAEIGSECGYPVICLGDLGEDDNMKAIGLFKHDGVAQHPGDLGMALIAKRIFEPIECKLIGKE